jgi:hypothetical protein
VRRDVDRTRLIEVRIDVVPLESVQDLLQVLIPQLGQFLDLAGEVILRIGLAVCEGVADEPPISSGRPQADLRSLDQDDVELRNPLLGLKRSPEAGEADDDDQPRADCLEREWRRALSAEGGATTAARGNPARSARGKPRERD